MIMKKETIDKIVSLASNVNECAYLEIQGHNEHISEYCSPYQCREIISALAEELNDNQLREAHLEMVIKVLGGLGYSSKRNKKGELKISYNKDEDYSTDSPILIIVNNPESQTTNRLFVGKIEVRNCKLYLLDGAYEVFIEREKDDEEDDENWLPITAITFDKVKGEMEIPVNDFVEWEHVFGKVLECYERVVALHYPINYRLMFDN